MVAEARQRPSLQGLMIRLIGGTSARMKLLQVTLTLALLGAFGCTHITSMSDPALQGLWNGRPLEADAVEHATTKWPKDVALLEMQQSFALLRKGDLSQNGRAEAKLYLERAVAAFDDLKEPNNFSTAFTTDANTPYRGRPYERVLASTFLGILDVADGRCDMAIPAFKTAEFLDARWQPFQFGSDAPIVYALTLRCLNQMRAAPGDIARAQDGLFRSVRLLETVEEVRAALEAQASHLQQQPYSTQISFLIIDAGLSSALMEAPGDAKAGDILERITSDAIRYYAQVLNDKTDPMFETLDSYAKKLEPKRAKSGACHERDEGDHREG
jgi:hypothetical protein